MLHKIKNLPKQSTLIAAIIVLLASSVIVYFNHATQAVSISELRQQSYALEQKISAANAQAEQLAAEADSLKKKIAQLDLQIQDANNKIDLITNKLKQLEIELNNTQKELDRQKGLLKASVVTLYKKGGASQVELLVGADSFTSYFNDQLYLEKLKAGVQESTEKVIELKQQIQAQQAEQEELLKQQQEIKASLDATRKERSDLLIETQGRESAYRQQTNELRAEQSKILSEIAARSVVVYSAGTGGGYPAKWANAPLDAYVDDWGMFTRECVSYAAFRVAASGRYMPYWGGRGNAKLWLGNARNDGIPTGTSPKNGAIAVWTNGYYGHVAHVDAILSDGRVKISEYNAVPPFGGMYSERIINPGDPAGYVYFQ